MSGYELALFLHILGVIILFGAIVLFQGVGARLRAAKTVSDARLSLLIMRPTGRMFPVGAVLLILTGLYMADQAWSFSTPWIVVAIVTIVLMLAVGGLLVGRTMERLGRAAMSAEDGVLPPELAEAIARGPWIPIAAQSGMALGIVWLMTVKPEWVGSIVAIIIFALLGAVAGVAITRRPAQSSPSRP
jgi:hypothetical protein